MTGNPVRMPQAGTDPPEARKAHDPSVAGPEGQGVSSQVPGGRSAGRRALVVAPQPFYQDRGTPIAVRQVLEALGELGYEADVLTFPIGESVPLPGVRYVRVANWLRFRHVPIGFSFRKLWLDLFLYAELRRMLRRTEYCCIHAVEEAAFLAVLAARPYGIPVIYDMQSSLPEQLAQQRLFASPPVGAVLRVCERWLIRRVSCVMSSAGLGSRVLAEHPGVRVGEWRYASPSPPGRPETEAVRRELGIQPDRPIVLYTGTFEDYQGLALLVEAMPRVQATVPDVVFVLVGAQGGNGADVATRLAQRLPADSYRLLQRQPRESIPPYLALADVAVSPRIFGSNLPLKVLDYLAAGCAIVATSIPAHRAVLAPELALLAEPSAAGLARGISQLLVDSQLRQSFQTAAIEYAREHLGWQAFVRSVEGLYEGIEIGKGD